MQQYAKTVFVLIKEMALVTKMASLAYSCHLVQKKQKSTLAAYIALKKNNVNVALLYTAIKMLHIDKKGQKLWDSKIHISQKFGLKSMLPLHCEWR